MDIEKLKAEFEKLKYIEEKLEYLNFDEHLDCYVEKSNGMPVGLSAWVNGALYGFQQAAKAQAVPEWISVEDELPPTDTMVLICWSDSPDIEPEKDFMDICTDTGCPFWANYLNDMPTHWMPLPEPPTKECK